MIVRSRRNLTINDLESERKNSSYIFNANNSSPSNDSNPFDFSLTNNASFLQNNDIQKSKEMESTRRDENHNEVSNQMTSLNPLLPPPFRSCLKQKGDEKNFKNI